MGDQRSGRPAVPNPATPTSTHTTITGTLYEAAFGTHGSHPQAGVALARTLNQARQRLADMLVFCDPTAPATADITALHHRARTVERYDGTAGDIFTRVNAGTPGRTVIAHPLSSDSNAATDGQR